MVKSDLNQCSEVLAGHSPRLVLVDTTLLSSKNFAAGLQKWANTVH